MSTALLPFARRELTGEQWGRAAGESVLVADTDLKAWAAAPREQTRTRGLTGVACKHQGEKKGGCILARTGWLGTAQWQAIFASD